MAEILLFHHAHGLTPGVHDFARQLRDAGHTVHVPDLYQGRVFDDLEEGVAHARGVGFGEIMQRGEAAAEGLPGGLVYAGFSLGVLPAQMLAQTRPGALGALLFDACVPPSEFGVWPEGVPVQIHGRDADPYFAEDGDLGAARGLVESTSDAELFLYPGNQHVFADNSLPSYDKDAAEELHERLLDFLDRFS